MRARLTDLQGGNVSTNPSASERTERARQPRRAPLSRQMVARLMGTRDNEAKRHAMRVLSCVEHRRRCNSRFHPACATRTGIARRRRVEMELDRVPPSAMVAVLTITVGCNELARGLDALLGGFARLRRLECFRPVLGGRGQVEVLAAAGAGCIWN